MDHPGSSHLVHFPFHSRSITMSYANTLEGTTRNLLGDLTSPLAVLCKWTELTHILLILDQRPWICQKILNRFTVMVGKLSQLICSDGCRAPTSNRCKIHHHHEHDNTSTALKIWYSGRLAKLGPGATSRSVWPSGCSSPCSLILRLDLMYYYTNSARCVLRAMSIIRCRRGFRRCATPMSSSV